MSIGKWVWCGVRVDLDEVDDDYCESRTLAPTLEACQQRIAELAEGHSGFPDALVPFGLLLIIKGRMT